METAKRFFLTIAICMAAFLTLVGAATVGGVGIALYNLHHMSYRQFQYTLSFDNILDEQNMERAEREERELKKLSSKPHGKDHVKKPSP